MRNSPIRIIRICNNKYKRYSKLERRKRSNKL
jgi:hypothetical protein